MRKLYTSESVTEGHPDKICDQIADAVLDNIIAQDPKAHVACEVCATTGLVLVMGESTTTAYADIPAIVRATVKRIGYDRGKYGFDADNLAVITAIDEQSPDIELGVKDMEGAGDQGLMFGYATDEDEEYMPLTLVLAHKLVQRLAKVRKDGLVDYLRPDGKAQVTLEYDDDRPLRADSIVISTQHDEKVALPELRAFIEREVIRNVIPAKMIDAATKIFINPTGRFVVGGPKGDSGLTGRKIIVDTYGGFAHHGGGSFSGKDPTKVDRSASYMARYIAKNIVASGLAHKVEIELSYVIGVADPTSLRVNAFGTSQVSEENLAEMVRALFPLTPRGIISTLDLRRPIYEQTAAYGHFGRNDLDLPWEKLDKVAAIQGYFDKHDA